MPKSGAVLLSEFPGDVVTIACRFCERRDVYKRANLIARYDNIGLPELLSILAAGYPRNGNMSHPCSPYFPDLARGRNA